MPGTKSTKACGSPDSLCHKTPNRNVVCVQQGHNESFVGVTWLSHRVLSETAMLSMPIAMKLSLFNAKQWSVHITHLTEGLAMQIWYLDRMRSLMWRYLSCI